MSFVRTLWLAACCIHLLAGSSQAVNCFVISIGETPLSDLGGGTYQGFQGGLYPGGVDLAPPAHHAEGIARAAAMERLATNGLPDTNGAIVMISIGLSNTTQEFCSQSGNEPCDPWTFMGQAAVHPSVDKDALIIANGALGGQAAVAWESPGGSNYDRIRDSVLAAKGLTEAQVQIAWIKLANALPSVGLPNPSADAFSLEASLGNVARSMKIRYPNLRLAFLSSRIYAGYADVPLNPEPYAYESAFAVKWLVEAQIAQIAGSAADPVAGDLDWLSTAPWLGWGPYVWADGLTPRSDGLVWSCADFEVDGTHPSMSGEEIVGGALLDFFLTSPYASPWFTVSGQTGGPTVPTAGWLTAAIVVGGFAIGFIRRNSR